MELLFPVVLNDTEQISLAQALVVSQQGLWVTILNDAAVIITNKDVSTNVSYVNRGTRSAQTVAVLVLQIQVLPVDEVTSIATANSNATYDAILAGSLLVTASLGLPNPILSRILVTFIKATTTTTTTTVTNTASLDKNSQSTVFSNSLNLGALIGSLLLMAVMIFVGFRYKRRSRIMPKSSCSTKKGNKSVSSEQVSKINIDEDGLFDLDDFLFNVVKPPTFKIQKRTSSSLTKFNPMFEEIDMNTKGLQGRALSNPLYAGQDDNTKDFGFPNHFYDETLHGHVSKVPLAYLEDVYEDVYAESEINLNLFATYVDTFGVLAETGGDSLYETLGFGYLNVDADNVSASDKTLKYKRSPKPKVNFSDSSILNESRTSSSSPISENFDSGYDTPYFRGDDLAVVENSYASPYGFGGNTHDAVAANTDGIYETIIEDLIAATTANSGEQNGTYDMMLGNNSAISDVNSERKASFINDGVYDEFITNYSEAPADGMYESIMGALMQYGNAE